MKEKIQKLQQQLTGNIIEDSEIREEISKLKRLMMEEEPLPPRPADSDFECFGCGS